MLKVNETDQHLWKVQFRRKETGKTHLEVWYAWSDGGPWVAAKNPRVWMTDRLYKIQVAGPAPEAKQASEVEAFLKVFLPELRSKIVST